MNSGSPGSYVDRNGQERLLGSRLPEGSLPHHPLLSREAVNYALARLPELVLEGRKAEPNRLWLNMLSSQPLCLSLFGHLAHHRDAGARVLDAVLPWTVDAIDEVLVEHAPVAAALTLGGGPAGQHSIRHHAGGSVRRRATRAWRRGRHPNPSRRSAMTSPAIGPLRTGRTLVEPGAAEIAKEPKNNQLWRNVMLAQETARVMASRHQRSSYGGARSPRRASCARRSASAGRPESPVTHTLLKDVIVTAPTTSRR